LIWPDAPRDEFTVIASIRLAIRFLIWQTAPMSWLQSLDVSLFRFVNHTLSNPWFDAVMPWLSGNALFVPLVLLAVAVVVWRGRGRGVLFLLLLAVAVGVTDGLVCNTLKHAFGRVRPCAALEGVHLLVGCSGSGSLPSSHAGNWFAGAMVAFLFHRRSWRVMLPLAMIISFSRVYNGVHYPSDVTVGGILGAGTGFAVVFGFNATWNWAGRKWFPRWYEQLPSLIPRQVTQAGANNNPATGSSNLL
jgi:membrane-associated phospholipid phosphatase